MCALCVNRCEGILLSSHLKITLRAQWEKEDMFLKCSERNKDILNGLKTEGKHRLRVDADMNVQHFIAYSMSCASENEKEDYFAEN